MLRSRCIASSLRRSVKSRRRSRSSSFCNMLRSDLKYNFRPTSAKSLDIDRPLVGSTRRLGNSCALFTIVADGFGVHSFRYRASAMSGSADSPETYEASHACSCSAAVIGVKGSCGRANELGRSGVRNVEGFRGIDGDMAARGEGAGIFIRCGLNEGFICFLS